MTWILEWIVSLLTFTVEWFWTRLEEYKESKSILRIILLFVISLSGLFLISGSLVWFVVYLFTYHIEIVVILGLIIWLYAYIKSRMDKRTAQTAESNVQKSMAQAEMQEQAQKAYPVIRNIIYQILKEVADGIGGTIPRTLQEIEVLECHYLFANNICFYQFKLNKADISMRYQWNELTEFQRILQTTISQKIQAGYFPTLGVNTYLDSYGNMYDAVYIDIVEDMDTYFNIQAVFYSPAYADYLRMKQVNQNVVVSGSNIPNASWNDRT